jgi:Ca2+-binding RTX toxin-like protein
VLKINDGADSLILPDFFLESLYAQNTIKQVSFSDGTSWDRNTLMLKALQGTSDDDLQTGYAGNDTLQGQLGNDTLNGGNGNDSLDGGNGNDLLYGGNDNDTMLGGAQNDTLFGGAGHDMLLGQHGNDTLFGQDGNDLLNGGAGNDYLEGGKGDDVYVMSQWTGSDTINNYDASGTDHDRVALGSNINENQVWFQRSGNNLQLTLIETNDKLTITNWYTSAAYRVDDFTLVSGKHLLEAQVDTLVNAMAAFAPPVPGQTSLPANYQTTLNAVIAASWK